MIIYISKITYIFLLNIGSIICVSFSIIIVIFLLFWCMNSLPNTGSNIQLYLCQCKKCNKCNRSSMIYNWYYLYK